MSHVPNGTERPRPFLPAKDFVSSREFYEALGFEKLRGGEVAIRLRGGSIGRAMACGAMAGSRVVPST